MRRRRALPSGRALVGGFLVAAASVGTFGAYSRATARPRRSYVVASHDIAVGTRLSPEDLAVARLELPDSLSRRAFSEPRSLVGATVLGPLDQGELVQAASVANNGDGGAQQVSFSLEAPRALNGKLARGERVDVLATYGGNGSEAYTDVVSRRVLVADVSASGSAMGNRTVVLTLALDAPTDVLAVTHAVRSGNVTIVRSGDRDDGPTRFRPSPNPPSNPAPNPSASSGKATN